MILVRRRYQKHPSKLRRWLTEQPKGRGPRSLSQIVLDEYQEMVDQYMKRNSSVTNWVTKRDAEQAVGELLKKLAAEEEKPIRTWIASFFS